MDGCTNAAGASGRVSCLVRRRLAGGVEAGTDMFRVGHAEIGVEGQGAFEVFPGSDRVVEGLVGVGEACSTCRPCCR